MCYCFMLEGSLWCEITPLKCLKPNKPVLKCKEWKVLICLLKAVVHVKTIIFKVFVNNFVTLDFCGRQISKF